LQRHRERPVSSAEIAVEAFNRSFGAVLSLEQQLTLLALAFEAMLGRWRAVDGRATSDRLETAMRLAKHESAPVVTEWFEAVVVPLRNDAAHGRAISGAEEKAAIQQVRSIVRCLVNQYLAFSQRWHSKIGAQPVGARIAIGCTEAFGQCLDRVRDNGLAEDAAWSLAVP
jgi:hypothetical protein